MRHVARKGLFTIAAAGGMLVAVGAAGAQADAGAEGAATNSPGVGSGNTVQAPVHVPVNACGNTVDVGGLLNPAYGNTCVNDGGGTKTGAGGHATAGGATGGHATGGGATRGHATGGGATGGGAQAQGQSSQSPGVLSGNTVQAPVDVPVNACGNSANVVGVGNAAFGNGCGNVATPDTPKPPKPEEPPTPDEPDRPDVPDTPEQPDEPKDRSHTPPNHETHAGAPVSGPEQLAETGSDIPVGALIPLSGGLLLGGAVLYRRARASAA
ncbi:chaplin [Streptomyces sp. NBC_01808]|uniref:chaplin n=1 Tax=Streptomyces sp. NBC_01808 TaxID=2975947 RepID=UPI002DDA3FE6|nr:chaplin [Streptomyces sp. NBC_01808]